MAKNALTNIACAASWAFVPDKTERLLAIRLVGYLHEL